MKSKMVMFVLTGLWAASAQDSLAQSGPAPNSGGAVGSIVSPAQAEKPEQNLGQVLVELQKTQAECLKKSNPLERAECFRSVRDFHGEAAKGYDRLATKSDLIGRSLQEIRNMTEQSIEPGRQARKEVIAASNAMGAIVADLRGNAESAKASADPENPVDDAVLGMWFNAWQDAEDEQAKIDGVVKAATAQTRISEEELKILDVAVNRTRMKGSLYRALAMSSRAQEKTWSAKAAQQELMNPGDVDLVFVPHADVPKLPMPEDRRQAFESWKAKTLTPAGESKVTQK